MTVPSAPHGDAAALPSGCEVRLASGARAVAPGVLLSPDPVRLLRVRADAPVLTHLTAGGTVEAARLGRRTARHLVDGGVVLATTRGGRPADEAEVRRRVVVVVPVRDRAAELATTLPPLVAQAPVIVVDDGSQDPDAVAAVVAACGARLVRRERNGGPGAARTTGLAATDAEVVAFVDSDVTVPPDWLARSLPALDDPRVALVAPRVRSRVGPSVRERYERAHGPLDLGARTAAVHPRGAVAYVPSAAWVLRRAALPDGFTAGMRVAEDVDAVWRLHAAGWGVRYRPDLEVTHQPRPTVTAAARQRASYAAGATRLALDHPGAAPPLRLAPWSATATVGVLSLYPAGAALAALAVGAATVKLARALPPTPDLVGRRRAEVAGRLVLRGVAGTARGVPRAALRAWPPLVPALAVVRPRAGALVVAGWTVDVLARRRARHHDDPATRGDLPVAAELVGRLVDDLAYAAGLWHGAWRARRVTALLPRSTRPPGTP